MNTERLEADNALKTARLEKVRKESELLQLRIDEASGRLLDADAVAKCWSDSLLMLRGQILSLPIPEAQRHEILESLVEIPPALYQNAARQKDVGGDDESAENAPPTQNPPAAEHG